MREIKFRAWNKTYNDMEMNVQDVSRKRIIGETACESFQEVVESWEFEVMEYTGIKDDNQVEIYEGDVIECTENTITYKAVVRFGEYEQDGSSGEYEPIACIGFYADAITLFNDYATSLLSFDKIKIIGNVWQNPGLIEGEAE